MMRTLFWPKDERMEQFFPKSYGKPRVDNRRVLSGIVFVNRIGKRDGLSSARRGAGYGGLRQLKTRLTNMAPIGNVASHFAMERMKFSTACPIETRNR